LTGDFEGIARVVADVDIRSGVDAGLPSDSGIGLGDIKVEVALEDRGDTADCNFCSAEMDPTKWSSSFTSPTSAGSSGSSFAASASTSSKSSFWSSSKESSSPEVGESSERGVESREASAAGSSSGVASSAGGLVDCVGFGETDSGGGDSDELLCSLGDNGWVSARGEGGADEWVLTVSSTLTASLAGRPGKCVTSVSTVALEKRS
jgi:hypothetical protein